MSDEVVAAQVEEILDMSRGAHAVALLGQARGFVAAALAGEHIGAEQLRAFARDVDALLGPIQGRPT